MGRPNQPIFQRSSSGTNLADLGMSTARRSTSHNIFASATTSRQSLVPGGLFGQQTPASASIQRRSSIYSRHSHGGPIGHQSFFTQPPIPAGVPKDPRPLRDRNFQNRVAQELLEYLAHNNFEMEMKHQLTQNSLKSPTQKDFNYIFQWLYKRIDPGYRFQKNIDAEVPPILKQLRYPYEKNITKSQIAAVGGQNWSTFLGLLHWMMQLAQMLDHFANGAYDGACTEAGVDVSGDRIVFRFLFNAYQDWLQVGPDEEDVAAEEAIAPHVRAMAAEFSQTNAKYEEELKIYEAEYAALKAQIEEFEKSAPDVGKLDKHYKILEDDKRKFEDYNANVQAKIEKYESRIKILETEMQKTDSDLSQSEQERSSLQASVDRQGLNIQDIDRMNSERERLEKNNQDVKAALEEWYQKVQDKELETADKLKELEAVVKRYNDLGYETSIVPSTASNANGQNYELTLTIDDASSGFGTSHNLSQSLSHSASRHRLLADTNIGHTSQGLVSLPDLRQRVRKEFMQLRSQIRDRRQRAHETDLANADILLSTGEALSEKHGEVDTLEHRLKLLQGQHDTLKDTSSTQHTQNTAAIERLEKELGRMQEAMQRDGVELASREQETLLAYESMKEEGARVREALHGQVEKALEEVVRFKMHVQRGLEEFEGWIAEEVEEELMGEVDIEGLRLNEEIVAI